MTGKPIFDYPPEHRAPEGEGCATCGIVLEADRIFDCCSPECCECGDVRRLARLGLGLSTPCSKTKDT